VPWARRAVELWTRLRDESGVDLITANGALMLGAPDTSVIKGAMRSIAVHNLPKELLDEGELRSRYPGHRVRPGEIGIRQDEISFLTPRRFAATPS
jgi:sarcosine oxidase